MTRRVTRWGAGRLLAAVVALVAVASPAGASPTPASLGDGYYSRTIRLAHAGAENGTILTSFQRGSQGVVMRSVDGGASFQPLSTIDAAPTPGGVCCIELFEFPQQLGAFPAGTLLWAGSVVLGTTPPRHMRLAIWRSDDHGATWQPHGACAESTHPTGGLWEPHFDVADDGSLVCLFSDETQSPAHSQILAEAVSTDGGVTFGPRRDVVSLGIAGMRPGMATTVRLPDGTWLLTFELCGWLPACQVRIRRGVDGVDWGPVDDAGAVVEGPGGRYLAHTPVLTWSPFGGPNGTLLLTGQLYVQPDGSPDPANGSVVLLDRSGGTGPWSPMPAPVPVPDAFDHYCPNYSSPVVALDGPTVIETATRWDGQQCTVWFATGTLPATLVTPTTAPPSTTAPPVAVPIATPSFTG